MYCEVLRIHIPRTPVNKGQEEEGRGLPRYSPYLASADRAGVGCGRLRYSGGVHRGSFPVGRAPGCGDTCGAISLSDILIVSHMSLIHKLFKWIISLI